MRSPFPWLAVGGVTLLGLDRFLKYFATHSLPPAGVFLVPGWLGLVQFHNSGIAFSLPANRLFILGATVVLLVWIAHTVLRQSNTAMTRGALVLLFLGAGSNFFDRLAYGSVIDYLRIGPWSLVNIADGMILAALLLLFLDSNNTKHPVHP